MDLQWKKMIESNIYDYISTVDYRHPDFTVAEFKLNLKKIIGIEPAVKLKWNTSEKINELKKQSGAIDYKEIIEKIEMIDITFIDENNKPIELKFIL
jgi:hypothetical protein